MTPRNIGVSGDGGRCLVVYDIDNGESANTEKGTALRKHANGGDTVTWQSPSATPPGPGATSLTITFPDKVLCGVRTATASLVNNMLQATVTISAGTLTKGARFEYTIILQHILKNGDPIITYIEDPQIIIDESVPRIISKKTGAKKR